MVPYLDCPHPDSSGITLEYYDSLPKIRFLEDGTTVKLHRHDFYEMVLILRGSCRHFYRSTYIPLMPGDLFLIPPDQPHSYRFHDSIAMCNCQFYRRILEHEPEQFIVDIEYTALQQKMPMRKRFEDIQAVWADSDHRLRRGMSAISTARGSSIWAARNRIIFSAFWNKSGESRRSRGSALSGSRKCCWKRC